MGETTSQIENHIANKREDLHSNLKELESKVKTATDWRHYYQQYTGTMVAVAFGGGVLTAAVAGKRRQTAAGASASPPSSSATPVQGRATHEILDTFDTIKTALVGMAATKFKGMLSEIVPGFSEHLANTESVKKSSPDPHSTQTVG